MNSFNTSAIILKRIDYGEADRIITFLTPEKGQVRAIAKGVRRPKSKLAGGLELLSESQVSFIESKNELKTVRSTRLVEHWGEIIKDYERMQFAYKAIEAVYVMTGDVADEGVYDLLKTTLESLNDDSVPLSATALWFYFHGLRIIGQQPNLETDSNGHELQPDIEYGFDGSSAAFVQVASGQFGEDHIKALRLLSKANPSVGAKINNFNKPTSDLVDVIGPMFDRIIALGA